MLKILYSRFFPLRTKTVLALVLLVLVLCFTATKAFAIVPLVILALSTIPTIAFFYATQTHVITKSIKSSTGATIILANNVRPDTVTSDDIAQNLGAIPSNTPPLAGGPFYITIPADGSYNKSGQIQTISGATIAEFLSKVMLCPSNICTFGGNVSTWFAPNNQQYITSTSSGVSAGLPVGIISYKTTANQGSVNIKATVGPFCSDGYTYNTTNSKCDLSNIQAARASGATDGVCTASHGVADPFDKDCINLKLDNKLTQAKDVDGNDMITAADVSGDGEITNVRGRPDGGIDISRTFPPQNGTQRREDTTIDPNGNVGPTSNANYPQPGAPVYPKDPGGTSIPSGTGTGTSTAQCGSVGQSPCATRIVDAQGQDIAPITAGDPVGGLGDTPEGDAKSRLESVKASASIPVTSNCPPNILHITIPFPASMGGDYVATDSGFICQAGDTYGPTVRLISIACAWIAAFFIVLRA